MRWITLVGRMGTVLLMIGLALALVSQIPSATIGPLSTATFSLPPEKYVFLDTMELTPQNGISISGESDEEIYVYILSVFISELHDWTWNWAREHFKNLTEPEISSMADNVTALEAFIENHEGVVLKKSDKATKLAFEFFPETLSNATVVVANPSPRTVEFTWQIKRVTTLAPRERVIIPAQWLISIGAVLTAPWLIRKYRR